MLLPVISILLGLGLLVWSADRFVIGAASLARNLGVPPLLIGLTVVGFGTSAPEIVVSTVAALQGNPGIGIGNAIGSNIANIAMILGATALVAPLIVRSDMVRREYPLLLAVSVCAYLLMLDGDLDRIDGTMLIVGLVIAMLLLIRIGTQRLDHDPLADDVEAELPEAIATAAATGWTLLGLVVLILSSKMLVWGAVTVAVAFGVSDLVIGLTIVAVGTSLPELAAAVAGALKREHDLVIGNVVGSNLWNLLAVLGLPGLLAPGAILPEVIHRDMLVMLGLTLALFAMGRTIATQRTVNRLEGGLLLASFIAYQGWLFWENRASLMA